MDSYVIKGKLHDDVWFCSIFKHEKLMNFTPSMEAYHDTCLLSSMLHILDFAIASIGTIEIQSA